MRSVTYSMNASLDGYIVGPDGEFNWTAPDPDVFRFAIDEIQKVGVHLYTVSEPRDVALLSRPLERPRQHERKRLTRRRRHRRRSGPHGRLAQFAKP